MITIHDKFEEDFSKNGFGEISQHVIDPKVTWKMNGEFKATLTYPKFARLSSKLLEENILRIPVPFMDDQPFRIYKVTERLGYMLVEAKHIFYDLMNNIIEDTNIVGQNGQGAIDRLLDGAILAHQFNGYSDISSLANIRIVRYNPVEALLDDGKANTFISRLGGQLYRDGFDIYMNTRIGSDRGVVIEHRKDLLEFNSPIDYSQIVNRLLPIGFDGLILPEKYVDAPGLDLNDIRIGQVRYQDVKAAVGEYAEDEDAIPLEDAYSELRRLAAEEFSINHVDKPKVNMTIDFATLHNTVEYEEFSALQEIHQGDTVTIRIPDEDKEFISNMVGFESDPLQENHYIEVTLGSLSNTLTGSSNVEIKRIEQQAIRNQNTISSIYQQVGNKTSSFHGYVPPTTISIPDVRLNDTYFQKNGDYLAIWQYMDVDGIKMWVRTMDTYFGIQLENRIDGVLQDAIDDKAELITKITTAQNAATDYADAEIAILSANLGTEITAAQTAADQAKTDATNKSNQALIDAKAYADTGISDLNLSLTSAISTAQTAADQAKADAISKANQALADAKTHADTQVGDLDTIISSKLTSGNGIHISTLTTFDTGVIKNGYIQSLDATKINAGIINSARINATEIITNGLTTNVIKSTHLETSTALIDKIFANTAQINQLTSKTAFITNIKAIDIAAEKITSGIINSARINAAEIITNGLTANIIKSTHIETSNALIDKIFANTAQIDQLTSKTAFINNIKAVNIDAARITTGTINAARLNASAIVTAGLTANVIKSTHLEASSALFDKLFATTFATDRLSAQTGWIKNANIGNAEIAGAKIAEATISGAKIMEATISDAHIQNLSVSKIQGDISNFIKSFWNGINSFVEIDSNGLIVKSAGIGPRLYLNKGNLAIATWDIPSGMHRESGFFTVSSITKNAQRDLPTGMSSMTLLTAESGFFAGLGYRGTKTIGSENWDLAMVVKGTTGRISVFTQMLFDGTASIRLNNTKIYPYTSYLADVDTPTYHLLLQSDKSFDPTISALPAELKGVGIRSGTGQEAGLAFLENGLVVVTKKDGLLGTRNVTSKLVVGEIRSDLDDEYYPGSKTARLLFGPSDVTFIGSVPGISGPRKFTLGQLAAAIPNYTPPLA